MRKKRNFLMAIIGIASIGVSTSIVIASNNYLLSSLNINKESTELDANKGIVPLDYFAQTPLLTQSTGPIISYGNKISAVDWYGAEMWSLDLTTKENEKYLPGGKYLNNQLVTYTNRVFINWAIDLNNNKLWLLSNTFNTTTGGSNGKPIVGVQNLIEVNSLTGQVLSSTPLTSFKPANDWQLFYQIQVLKNGNVQIYAQGNGSWGRNILVDAKTKAQVYSDTQTTEFSNKINQKIEKHIEKDQKGQTRMLYLVPVLDNVNIAVFSDFARDVTNAKQGATSDLVLCLVDDNLREIPITDPTSPWYDYIYIKNMSDDFNDNKKAHNFNKSIYSTLDGRVYYSAWQKFFVFYPTFKAGYGIGAYQYDLGQGKRVQSYTMDVNENVFVKYWEDTKVYKFVINGNNDKNTSISPSTYYDIASSNEPLIQQNADKFILYNVTGYTGSIMMLSSRILTGGNSFTPSTDEQSKNYGIAASIVPNKNNQESGDTLGLLNTEKSFLKSSDFKIEDSILNSKIPSEITRSDLTLENGGFFTNNTTKNEDGTLKYPPFKISDINDNNGTFKITVNLDQIPWFTTTLPSNAIPKTITKEFKTNINIGSKVSWKKQEDLSYDFKNTLPSDLTIDEINNFDPFQVSFNSQTILDNNGKVLYPKKTYEKSATVDNTGSVTVSVKYEYIPQGEAYTSSTKPQVYNATNTYTIFNSNTSKEFYFAGSNEKASNTSKSPIDINNVPQLKALSESNLLPSSFNSNDRNSFLQFINTNKSKGYPISRISFSVQANDTLGTLTVIATTNDGTFRQEYTGFNKTTEYSFAFLEVTKIDNNNFNTLLPSSVNEGNVIDNLVKYSGFNSSDFQTTLYPSDDNGTLRVKIELSKKYASSLGNSHGFNNYVIEKTYSGFMTTNEYNSKYNVAFKNDSDPTLIEIKKMTLSSIEEALKKPEGLEINGTKYTNLNDLVENVFVESLGSKIPTKWKDKTTQIKTNMAINNQAGTMNLSISISKDLLDGYDSDLNYVISYSGFTKGNAVVTADNLSFIDQNLLIAAVPELKGKKPSDMAIWLESKENLKKIIFNCTGQYNDFIESNQYKLHTDANDSYNTITITIEFTGQLINESSLKEYSIQYKL